MQPRAVLNYPCGESAAAGCSASLAAFAPAQYFKSMALQKSKNPRVSRSSVKQLILADAGSGFPPLGDQKENSMLATTRLQFWLYLLLALNLTGCSTVYYNTMERAGYHKRDILMSRVQKARDTQQEAKQQFQSALERFQALTKTSGGKLDEKYKFLKSEFDKSESKADAVHKRINDIESVGGALFKEWEKELEQYSSASLKRSSEQKMQATRQRYDQLLSTMRKAESKIAPVLNTFRDHVLFLKHNLNAQAVASLQGEVREVETDVSSLLKEMESSIREADAFIRNEGCKSTGSAVECGAADA